MSKTYFTSDWHLYHKNILEYDQRPFRDIEHMHEVLINNYNNTVNGFDTCYFLGDMGFCKENKLKPIIDQLNGTKVFVLGNHDKGSNSMKDAGFDVVLYGAVLWIASERVTLSHCPLKGIWRENVEGMRGGAPGENWHGESRHAYKYSFENQGQYHLHGHTHKAPQECILDRQYDVGVRANKYVPVSSTVIESWIAKTRGTNGKV